MSGFHEIRAYTNESEIHQAIMSNVENVDFAALYNQIKYQGFNRAEFLKAAAEKLSLNTLMQIAMIGAVRGSNYLKVSKMANLPASVKRAFDDSIIMKDKPTKSTDITITRCTAALPQYTALALLVSGAVGRMSGSGVPSCLQFPAAASLPMSPDLRAKHIKWSDEFSSLIGGRFKSTIYRAMYNDRVVLAHVPDQVKAVLGITSDSAAEVDIDALLSGYNDEEEIDEKPEVIQSVRGSKRRKY